MVKKDNKKEILESDKLQTISKSVVEFIMVHKKQLFIAAFTAAGFFLLIAGTILYNIYYENQAEKIYRKALTNFSDFENLAQQFTEKASMKNRKGDLGYQNANSPRSIIKAAFEAGENKIIGPLEENNFFYVIRTGDIQPERQRTLAEVEAVVRSAVQKEKQDRSRQQILKELQNEYVFWIDETQLKKLS